ncbi:MAG: efflux RND transporter permease subunit [Thiohalomonadaceae bacterium]
MKGYGHGGGPAAWSIRHPIGVSMIALAVVVLGLFAFVRLSVDLLPNIIYPEIRVSVTNPGVPARIMEDQVTRHLEEQLAVTENSIAIQSRSSEGRSSIDLSFAYGTDIDVALRDASTRLDRARRLLPEDIDPPTIFKRDPSQIAVIEFVVSSPLRDPAALRTWVDYDFSKQFLNLPGVAAVEVGGGVEREIQVLPDQQRLAAMRLTLEDVVRALEESNSETAVGRLTLPGRELSGRTTGRFTSVDDIRFLPLRLADGTTVALGELCEVRDTHADQRVLVRLDRIPGVKISVQKQPSANTVDVVDAVNARLEWLREQKLIPDDVEVMPVADQSVYVRSALDNATGAALSGMILAMLVVYVFLGDLRRTLIIGSAIPIAVMVTFTLMSLGGLTFNIMTLGGLALGIGMLVDNTIVMLENVYRHQRKGEEPVTAGTTAAAEITSALVASTTTNLAAVLPFLFIGGLVGLLFRELIFTISAAIVASLAVAITLVPAWGVHVRVQGRQRAPADRLVHWLQDRYGALVNTLLTRRPLRVGTVVALVGALGASVPVFLYGKQDFLPQMDTGEISVSINADPGIDLPDMDRRVAMLEELFRTQPEVRTVFATVGGSVYGRNQVESSNRSSLTVQLVPREQREVSAEQWIRRMQAQIAEREFAGMEVRMRQRGVRGIRVGRGDDDISVRVQGPDLDSLSEIADRAVARLRDIPGLSNLTHSAEERRQELNVVVDRARAAALGLDPQSVGLAVRRALDGEEVTELFEGDRSFTVRLRLPRGEVTSPLAIEQVIIASHANGRAIRLGEVANIVLGASPAEIMRDGQRRIVEITATLGDDLDLASANKVIKARLAGLELPPGYAIYDGGGVEALQKGTELGRILLGLAVFLVFVVLAVQYESVRNPVVILLSVPFAASGVALSLVLTGLPLSMPVWLGLIMLTGIVVNNAILLVEYVELARGRGLARDAAIVDAARLRLRPILMTTLTTVMGMLPLALGWGEGAEMLQPLAVAMVGGLSLSLLVTLVLVPIVYRWFHPERGAETAVALAKVAED